MALRRDTCFSSIDRSRALRLAVVALALLWVGMTWAQEEAAPPPEGAATAEPSAAEPNAVEPSPAEPSAAAPAKAVPASSLADELPINLSWFQQTVQQGRTWAVTEGPRFAVRVAAALVLLLVFFLLSRFLGRVVRRALDRQVARVSRLFEDVLVSVVVKGTLLLGLLVAITQLGVNLGPLLAGLGVAGFIVGFAVQDSLSNFAAGMMILAYRPYDVGDTIEAGGVFGKVARMTLVSTTFVTFDNQRLTVPNSKIWGGVIKNVNAEPTRRVDLVFGIGYDDDVEHAERVLQEIVAGHPLVLAEPEPVIQLDKLADSSVDFVVRPWVATPDYWQVYWDITRTVKLRFDAEGISIPFPQRDVHLYQSAA